MRGYGRSIWKNGETYEVYEGMWENNMFHGEGKKTHTFQKVFDGEWQFGRFVPFEKESS